MGKLDVSQLRFLTRDDLRTLIGVEMGMRNHEIVPGPLVAQLAGIRHGRVHNKLYELSKKRLTAYERGRKFDGYRLTNKGYDYLSLHVMAHRGSIQGFGNQIGVGKESDIYIMDGADGTCCMKVHRLGRTSFRNLKEKRDYLGHRTNCSWLYFSRLSATKEFAFLNILYDNGFPVPKPIDMNRHIIIMELIKGYPLCHAIKVENPGELYQELMDLIIKLANHGLIHCDFNEFNIMINEDNKPVLIDLPQMVSIDHTNAKMYFDRDVECVRNLFKRKYNFIADTYPQFDVDIERIADIDRQAKASGYGREIMEFDKLLDDNEDIDCETPDETQELKESKDDEPRGKKSEAEEELKKVLPNYSFDERVVNWVNQVNALTENDNEASDKESLDSSELTQLEDINSLECEAIPVEDATENRAVFAKTKNVSKEERAQLIAHYSKLRKERQATGSTLSFDGGFEDSRSILTTSTIPDVRNKLLKEARQKKAKNVTRKSRLVKGEASAVNRKRRAVNETIKECANDW